MYSLKLTIYIYVYCQILHYTHMYIINFKLYVCVYYEKLMKNVWSRMLLKFGFKLLKTFFMVVIGVSGATLTFT
ncbi:hypothetical protein Hanom_Chr09g00825981 [Helianthus anomalus]